jgi:ribulose-phosphate 3-epimerase
MVLLMSINPGFGGQKFEEMTYKKVKQLRTMINKKGLKTHIEIDGGVNGKNARKLLDAGADVLVAGSYIFKSENPSQKISELKTV